ncbi:MAG: polyprenyl synthetase family protein [Lachnospiraceae bacterium]|nr:polyprenyl synthetase family protein [Lachnospiraceae bacterium]
MDFSTRLNELAAFIDEEMKNRLPETDPDSRVLFDAMRYSAEAGGKRIRPVLALLFSRLFGGKDEDVLPFACAIEMVHTYSLIHDDLPCMDNDDYRRGKPTNHKVFGYANAVLAGDALLTYAFEELMTSPAPAGTKCRAASLLAQMAGPNGMVGGQIIDGIGETEKLSYEMLLKMNRLKTGCLIRCACLLGAYAAGADEEMIRRTTVYADAVGLAFQIEDDILDEGEEGKTTFLTYLTVDEAKEKIAALTEKAKEAISVYEGSETLTALADYLAGRKK